MTLKKDEIINLPIYDFFYSLLPKLAETKAEKTFLTMAIKAIVSEFWSNVTYGKTVKNLLLTDPYIIRSELELSKSKIPYGTSTHDFLRKFFIINEFDTNEYIFLKSNTIKAERSYNEKNVVL